MGLNATLGDNGWEVDPIDDGIVRAKKDLTGRIRFSGIDVSKLERPVGCSDPIKVAFVGDSMTSLASDSLARGFNAFVEQLGGDAVVGVHSSSENWGFSRPGATIQNLVDEGFGIAAANSDATHVVFLAWANSQSSTDATDAANLESLKDLVAPSVAAGKFITVCAPLQRTNETNATQRLHMTKFAQMVIEYAEDQGFFAVDFHSDSINRADGNIRPDITGDQVHPTMAWNWRMANKLIKAWGVSPRHSPPRGLSSLIENPFLQDYTGGLANGWSVADGTAAEYTNSDERGGSSQKITAVEGSATAATLYRSGNSTTEANRKYIAVAEVEIFDDSQVTGIRLDGQMYFTPVEAPWYQQWSAGGIGSPVAGEVYMPKGVYILTREMSLPNPSGTNGISLQIANGYAAVHYLGIIPA